jgi:ferritin
MADKHNDHVTQRFLTQFAPQQIADTAEADDVHDRLLLVGGDGLGLILIDQELARKAETEG